MGRPARSIESLRVIGSHTQQIVKRRQLHALVRHQKAEVLQMGIGVAHQHIEHQPGKKPCTGQQRTATDRCQLGKPLDAALAVLEAAIQTRQLAGIHHMPPLPPR